MCEQEGFDVENVKAMITYQKMVDQLVNLIDQYKDDNDIKLKKLIDKFYERYMEADHSIRSYHSFYNQYYFISSLFTYVCLVSVKFYDSIPDTELKDLPSKWSINNASVEYSLNQPVTLSLIIRRLRNSIAHGRFEFYKEDKNIMFKFKDVNFRDRNDHIKIIIKDEEILNFTQALSYWCITGDSSLKDF